VKINKYTFRRLLAGIVIIPAVALVYTLLVLVLYVLGADWSGGVASAWSNGLMFGVMATIAFALFAELLFGDDN
jgi:hypothetical protein